MNPPSDCLPTGISAFRPPSDGLPTTLPTAFQHPSDGCVPTPHTPHASEAAFSGPWWPLSGSHAGHRKEMAMTATALVTCEMPQSWSLKRAGCASPKLSPAAVSVSTAAHPRAGSAIAPVDAAPSYPQSGGQALSGLQSRWSALNQPSAGPVRAPAPPLAPLGGLTARRTPTPRGHLRGWLQDGAGFEFHDRRVASSLNRELLTFFNTVSENSTVQQNSWKSPNHPACQPHQCVAAFAGRCIRCVRARASEGTVT
jgi:hypothetical protein